MTWWHYLLLVNFYLVLFFGFYTLLLRRETFFQLNRIYLVAASLLSFFIPLIQADWVKNLFITQEVQHTIYGGGTVIYNFTISPVANNAITLGQVINVLYIAVTVFLLVRLMWQLLVLKKAIEKPSPSAAYSFFKKISLGENNAQSTIITQHEQVHASQWHSIDVMIIEAVMIINWFNPVVYLYRFAIKYIHEFIADRQVIQAGTDKVDYAMLLLSQTFEVDNHTLVTPFYNHSLLKQRITMLQKNKSQRMALAKYGLSAPLFILMLIFSSATINNSKAVTLINKKTEIALATPATDVVGKVIDNSPAQPENAAASVSGDDDKIYSQVEKQPEFPGGLQAFGQFLANNIHYPAADKAAKISGTAIVTFVVERNGSLSNIKVVRSPSKPMGAEAARVLLRSPKWKPGYNAGKAVRVSYTVPIKFTLPTSAGNKASANNDKVFSQVEKQPEFPGGLEAFGKFLGATIKYPAADREKGLSGRVICTFIVETDGSLSDIKAVHGPSETMNREAERALLLSPKWKAGVQNGHVVRTSYTVPINFNLGGDDDVAGKNKVYTAVDKQPSFPGGLEAFGKYLSNTVHYPGKDRESGISGKVIARFVVEPDGSLTNIKVVKQPTEEMGYEAIRVLALSPKWQPGLKDGKPVRVIYTVPINFVLEVQDTKTSADFRIGGHSPAPIYIVDGVEVKMGASGSPLNAIPQENIERMEVLKGETATKEYGDRGKNGVVLVTTKQKAAQKTLDLKSIKGTPFVLIDGKPTSIKLDLIDMSKIATVEVLKDQTATALYGQKAKDGAILLTTKGYTYIPNTKEPVKN